jgi:hypothetical protein
MISARTRAGVAGVAGGVIPLQLRDRTGLGKAISLQSRVFNLTLSRGQGAECKTYGTRASSRKNGRFLRGAAVQVRPLRSRSRRVAQRMLCKMSQGLYPSRPAQDVGAASNRHRPARASKRPRPAHPPKSVIHTRLSRAALPGDAERP